jgi:hypothetical protein
MPRDDVKEWPSEYSVECFGRSSFAQHSVPVESEITANDRTARHARNDVHSIKPSKFGEAAKDAEMEDRGAKAPA